MKFPKGVRAVAKPKMRNHRGRTWDVADLTLPDGTVIHAHLDTTWSLYFYFEVGGVWRRAEIGEFEHGSSGHTLRLDLRDQKALAEVELKIVAYETAIMGEDKALIERLGHEVEELATAAGYNGHQRLAALHTLAEVGV